MRKIRFTILAVLMAGLFITNGCVKNEESEGVKQLRLGQAALLQARATATTMEAEAEAAYTLAMAAVQEAQAQMNLANARKQEILNELNEAQNENTIAQLQLALEILQAEQEYEIAVAVAEAKELLNAAEISLMASIRALEKATAENENALLEEYLNLYKAAIAEVVAARADIVTETGKLARYQIYVNGVGGDLVAEKLREQEKLERELALNELYKSKLDEVLGDPSSMNDERLEASRHVDSLKKDRSNLYKEEEKLSVAEIKAKTVRDAASDDYNEVKNIIANNSGDIDNWTNNIIAGLINDNDFDLTINGNYNSKVWYEGEIADAEEDIATWQSEIADFEVTLANQQEVYNVHAAKLAELYTAYVADEATYQAAEQAYQVAKAEYEADDSAENLTAMNDAETARDTAEGERDASLLEHDTYKLNYYDSALAAVEGTQDNIEDREDWIADAQEDIADWLADHAIVVDYIAFLQAELDDALLAYDDVKLAYTEAYSAWVVADQAYSDSQDEITMINVEIGFAENYVNLLEGEFTSMETARDNIAIEIESNKKDLAELDVTFATWESAIAAQQDKIEVLEAELAYWEAVANDYKVMFEGEMGNE
ncbi:MAG: hypothetical protein ACFCUM_18150 [Bacteroidales bacterium]